MIDQLAPITRKQLVESRCLAMQGKATDVISGLDIAAAKKKTEGLRLDAIALMLLKAELLYLDNQSEPALSVFHEKIDPELNELPDDVRLVIASNRNWVSTWLEKEHIRDFYIQLDERRLAGVNLWDKSKLLDAVQSAEEGSHYESLPLIWNELLSSYMKGSWLSFWIASKYMAKECLQLGWPHEAAYHAIVARSSELGEAVGRNLTAKRDPHAIELTIDKILNSANLHLHASVACSVIGIIGDAISEQQVERVFRWLIHWCNKPRHGLNDAGLLEKAWRALGKIVWGLNVHQMREIVKVATSHPVWNGAAFDRRHLVPVVNRCVARLPLEDLPALTRQVLPLATSLKGDFDFIETINLLTHMAERGGEPVKSIVAETLFPIGTQITNSVLAQVAPVFGRITDTEGLNKTAEKLAREVRLLVQRMRPDETPHPVSGGFGTLARTKNDEKIVVQNGANTLALGVLVKHKHLLNENALRDLVESLLAALVDAENLISNKIQLVEVLSDFGDRLTPELTKTVFATLLPFAEGNIEEPSIGMNWKDANSPLNPFKMRDANPAQLRGIAVYALASIEKDKPGSFGDRIHSLLEAALGDTDSEVRRLAFAAARETPSLSDAGLTAVLMGTRDSDPKVAATAYYAFANKRNLKLGDAQWELLYYAMKLALKSEDSGVRRAAARATANLRPQAPKTMAKRIDELVDAFEKDISYSVRSGIHASE